MDLARINSLSAGDLMREASVYQEKGDFAGAEAAYRIGVERFRGAVDSSGHSIFHKELVRVLLRSKQWEKAQAIVGDRTKAWHPRLFAQAYSAASDIPWAAFWWAEVIKATPDDEEANEWFRLTALQEPRWPADPNDTVALGKILQTAQAMWNEGRKTQAGDIFIKGAIWYDDYKDWRGNIFLWEYMARAVGQNNKEAMSRILGVNQRVIDKIFYDLDKGMRQRREIFSEEQKILHRKMIDLEDRDFDKMLNVAQSALSVRDFELVDEFLFKSSRKIRDSVWPEEHDFTLKLLSGDLLLCRGEIGAAYDCFVYAERMLPSSIHAGLGLAISLLEKGYQDDAIDSMVQISETLPEEDSTRIFLDYFINSLSNPTPVSSTPTIDMLIFGHPTERMIHNHHIAPPRTDMVESILTGVRERRSEGETIVTTILYDHRDTDIGKQYVENLKGVAQRYCVQLVVNHQVGLRRQWLDGLSRGDGEFLLIVEQDHKLLPSCPNWKAIRTIFETRKDVNYVRMNRNKNDYNGLDFFSLQTPDDLRSNIFRTCQFSNTPHMMRRSFYEKVVYPIITSRTALDGGNGGAAGVEENMNRAIDEAVSAVGWPITARILGLGIWGKIGDSAVTEHLGY